MGALQKPQIQLVHTGASSLRQSETPPRATGDTAPGRRQIGDLRVRGDIARVIGAELPEGAKLEEDQVTLCGDVATIQFHRIIKGTQYVALLYIEEGYDELAFESWFLSSVCVRIFTTLIGLRLDGPSIEIIATRSGLLSEDWRDELDACAKARIAKSTRITRIAPWMAAGLDSSLPLVRVWIRELGLQRDDSQNERGDSFGQTARVNAGDSRAAAAAHAGFEKAKKRKAPLVFISYSHDPDDKPLFDKLKRVLYGLNEIPEYQKDRPTVVWTDEEIRTGDYWKPSIEEAIDAAPVVVALVTPAFLYSPFIKNEELRPTLERAKKREKKVAWVPGAMCGFEDYGLDELQAACDPKRPLNTLSQGELDILLNEVRKKVKGLLDEILANDPD